MVGSAAYGYRPSRLGSVFMSGYTILGSFTGVAFLESWSRRKMRRIVEARANARTGLGRNMVVSDGARWTSLAKR